jgi:hypothetical protein
MVALEGTNSFTTTVRLVCGKHTVIRDISHYIDLLEGYGISIDDPESTPKGLFLAYYDLILAIKHNHSIDKRILTAIVHSVVTHYPCLLILYPTLEEYAIRLYSKDEVLLAVYGRFYQPNPPNHELLKFTLRSNWSQRTYFRECIVAERSGWCLNRFSLMNRIFIRLPGDLFYEEIPGSVATPTISEMKTIETTKTMLSLSRLQPCILPENIFVMLRCL